jgi:hypothetical protein
MWANGASGLTAWRGAIGTVGASCIDLLRADGSAQGSLRHIVPSPTTNAGSHSGGLPARGRFRIRDRNDKVAENVPREPFHPIGRAISHRFITSSIPQRISPASPLHFAPNLRARARCHSLFDSSFPRFPASPFPPPLRFPVSPTPRLIDSPANFCRLTHRLISALPPIRQKPHPSPSRSIS